MTRVRYQVVQSRVSADDLARHVEDLLNEGWELAGGLVITPGTNPHGEHEAVYSQAVHKAKGV